MLTAEATASPPAGDGVATSHGPVRASGTCVVEDASRRRFGEIERAIREADPGFVARANRAAQFDKVVKVVMAVLLLLGTVLMMIGLATKSMPLWLLGVAVALLAPLFAEAHHRVGRWHHAGRQHPNR